MMRNFIDIVESQQPELPSVLRQLAKSISTKSWEAAKRLIVSRTGSVGRNERFDDEVADAVFLRIQQNAQVGRYDDIDTIERLGRRARRLEGDDTVQVYRAAPRNTGIRPGDFCTFAKEEAANYVHGGHVIHARKVIRHELIAVDGSVGGEQELIYLPANYERVEPQQFFDSFRDFYEASSDLGL